jgi:hypothetical protein
MRELSDLVTTHRYFIFLPPPCDVGVGVVAAAAPSPSADGKDRVPVALYLPREEKKEVLEVSTKFLTRQNE